MKYTNKQLIDVLSYVLNLGYSHIDHLSKQLSELKLTPEEIKENKLDNPRLAHAQIMINNMALLGDVLHPAFEYSLKMLPDKVKPFIQQIATQHEVAFANKMASTGCPCKLCKSRVKKIDNANEIVNEVGEENLSKVD